MVGLGCAPRRFDGGVSSVGSRALRKRAVEGRGCCVAQATAPDRLIFGDWEVFSGSASDFALQWPCVLVGRADL